MEYYLLSNNGEQKGPHSLDQIRAMWADGKVDLDTFHWSEKMEEWKPLRVIEETIVSPPAAAKPAPPPAIPYSAPGWSVETPKKKPFFNWRFLWYMSCLFFVLALMTYFFFPDALNAGIKVVYDEYEYFFPPPPQALPQRPVVVAPPAPKLAPPVVVPDPPQLYSNDEIKSAIQSNLVDSGVIQGSTTCDWKRLEHTDDTDVQYEMFAHLSDGTTKFCTGKVVLNPKKHQIVISSQLSG
jgi:hypothetical protein